MKGFIVFILALPVILISSDALAWGPGTHLYFGMSVLDRLSELGPTLRNLLQNQPLSFLYGCVSADIVLAKKLGRSASHCHNWGNGFRLIDEAKTSRTQAFSLGYVSHLAADTISHNCYVPSKTIESYGRGVLKHMYWELLFDRKVGDRRTTRLFKEIAKGDFSDCDTHMDQLVPTRLFDFSTNKRIFNQLLMLQSLKQWQNLWGKLSGRAPWTLPDREVNGFTRRSMAAVMSFLKEGKESPMVAVDPTGGDRLKTANKLRRHYHRNLRTDSRPSAKQIYDAVDRFASEPFEKISFEDHAAA